MKRWQVTAAHAGHHHAAGMRGNRLPADPLEHLDLLLVMVRVAAGAIAGGVQQPLLVERVLDAEVAVQAVDGVLGHVLGVHEVVVADSRQVAFAVVADEAPLAGHLALAADHVGVAIDAIDALLVRQFVGELDAPAQIVFLLGNLMAVGAGGQTLVERLVLEMAEEAGRRGHRHVLALHDLAVATGAAQLLAAAQSRPCAARGRNGRPGTRRGPKAGGSRGSRSEGNWRRAPRPPGGGPRSW